MVKSMTGFGRVQEIVDGKDILVEVKSVNHRYFEFSARTPRAYSYLDDKLKNLSTSYISRGKVELSLNLFLLEGKDSQVEINLELARSYVDALRSVKNELYLEDDLSLTSIARFQELFQVRKTPENEEMIWEAVKPVAEKALSKFVEMRQAEGERMASDISSRLQEIAQMVSEVERISPQTQKNYQDRLYTKLTEVLEGKGIDEQRILTETAVFADKIAVDEETVRLRSHIEQFRRLLEAGEPVGRKLDFLVQEMNREVNTIGSKCQNLDIVNLVVNTKAEIEKIREQIQNIE